MILAWSGYSNYIFWNNINSDQKPLIGFMVSTDIYQTGHKVQSFDVTSTQICLATRFQFQLVFVIRFELEPGGFMHTLF